MNQSESFKQNASGADAPEFSSKKMNPEHLPFYAKKGMDYLAGVLLAIAVVILAVYVYRKYGLVGKP